MSYDSELIDIGGRALRLARTGDRRPGVPPVIFEAGMGDTLATWDLVAPAIADQTLVCRYDRAGLGGSDPAPGPRTAQDLVDDLAALLRAAAIDGPYILVGHSFGALLVRLFAAQHPAAVAAMILIDPAHEDKYERFEAVLGSELIARQRAFLADPARNSEQLDLPASCAQLRARRQQANWPLQILSRGQPDPPSPIWPSAALQAIELALHRELLGISNASSTQRVPGVASASGHFIQRDQPDLVIEAIGAALECYR